MNPHTLVGIEAQIYAAAWGAAFAQAWYPRFRSDAGCAHDAQRCAEEAVRRFREQAGKESPDG